MKVVILAGGRGTRIADETGAIPKPMVHIGSKPMLWHIMMLYSSQGFSDFLIASGYRGEAIKIYFRDYAVLNSDYTVDLASGKMQFLTASSVNWKVGVIDTGLDTMTGGRVLRLRDLLDSGTFMVTYGDGLGDVDLRALLEFHRAHGKKATVTAVRPASRFGRLELQGDAVSEFSEKPQTDSGWINGGFFVFEPGVFDYLEGDATILERQPLEKLAQDGELMAFRHEGFWQPMDTVREKDLLERLWLEGTAPWKTWK